MRKNIYDEPCACQDSTILALDRTSVSRMVAASSLLCFFIFVTGYFWGKRHAVESFATAVQQEAMADRLQMSFATMGQDLQEVTPLSHNENLKMVESVSGEQLTENSQSVKALPSAPDGKTYFAQLVGFGVARNAKRFVQKLAKSGITEIEMMSRTSRMRNGKTRTWYQVVTKPFADHEQLAHLVDKIKNIEKLHDVRIVAQNA